MRNIANIAFQSPPHFGQIPSFAHKIPPRICGATQLELYANSGKKFQSTPRKRGATCGSRHNPADQRISIHAPQARGGRGVCCDNPNDDISIHAPQARGDGRRRGGRRQWKYFNPRPASAGRPRRGKSLQTISAISIHAPQARGDFKK